MPKHKVVEGKRYLVVQDLGYSSSVNGYGALVLRNGSPDLAVKLIGDKGYNWYVPNMEAIDG